MCTRAAAPVVGGSPARHRVLEGRSPGRPAQRL